LKLPEASAATCLADEAACAGSRLVLYFPPADSGNRAGPPDRIESVEDACGLILTQ
jgi:hypothetical protein